MVRLAQLDRDGWQLESAEERHDAHPDTFWIPSRRQRTSLGVGEGAKLLFAFGAGEFPPSDDGVERMWVIVRRREARYYVGVLDSMPTSPAAQAVLARGTDVLFGPEHVADVSTPARAYVVAEYGHEFFDA